MANPTVDLKSKHEPIYSRLIGSFKAESQSFLIFTFDLIDYIKVSNWDRVYGGLLANCTASLFVWNLKPKDKEHIPYIS